MNPADSSLPGHDLVEQGLADLANEQLSDSALLVLIAGPRLKRLGILVPHKRFERPFEHLLFERLEERLGAGAHAYYSSLLRRIVSYAHALEREQSQSQHEPGRT